MAARGKAQWKRNKFVDGFASEDSQADVSDALIRQARHSGQLNLSNRNLIEVPQKVWKINIDVPDDGKDVSLDKSSGDRWWEQTDLRKLILASNKLKTIPADIQNLPALSVLDVHDNQLESLPDELKLLSDLTKLSLSHNLLKSLPPSLDQLQCLKVVLLSHNHIENLNEDFGNLTSLEELDLSNNKISSLPASFGNLSELKKLNLSHNVLKELPSSITALSLLRDLELQNNQLQKLPCGIENMKSLNILNCRANLLSEFPTFSGSINVKEIYLGNNRIKHLNPEIFKSLSLLVILDVKDNTVQRIPEEIVQLSRLERLDLSNNCISGLPAAMGNMESIKSLSLDGNPLKGIRRDIMTKGTKGILEYLKSRIVVSAPVASKETTNAVNSANTVSEINGNNISDQTDKVLYDIRATKKIDYSNKQAKSVPDDYFVDTIVNVVDFSKNVLDMVPMKLIMYRHCLSELNLSSNKIAVIPPEIATLEKIKFLDLGNNALSSLPSELRCWKSLTQIVISGNRFQIIPEFLYDIQSIEVILASSNQITTIDVQGLLKLASIGTLDLSNNNILNVPPELGNLKTLKSLRIEGNPFRNPRHAILQKGTLGILEYLRDRIPK